jgi:hypothetical protein
MTPAIGEHPTDRRAHHDWHDAAQGDGGGEPGTAGLARPPEQGNALHAVADDGDSLAEPQAAKRG